ncbi:MAG: hypothetical protein IPJ65_37655 [Archangiaceae bacterium]|nr:hypothetical protein [Archangiaceae bacterium]
MSTDSISLQKLARFAPPALATALVAEKKEAFTAADVVALASRYRDSQDFEAAGYLGGVLTSLGVDLAPVAGTAAPKDPITAEAEAAAAKKKVSGAAQAIIAQTRMPVEHAELYAEAGYSPEQASAGWKAGLKGGEAFMYHHLGLSSDDAISLATAKVRGKDAYALIQKDVPAAQIPMVLASALEPYELRAFEAKGFNPAEAAELKALGFDYNHMPSFVTLAQVKVALEKGVPLDKSYTLLHDDLFTFEQMLALYAAQPDPDVHLLAGAQRVGVLPFDDVLALARLKFGRLESRNSVTELVKAGFSVAQIAQCTDFNFNPHVIDHALTSGYSPDELIAMWKKDIGLNGRLSCQSLPALHQAGFALEQLETLKAASMHGLDAQWFVEAGFKADEILNLVAKGYDSFSKFKEENLDLGLDAREAYDMLMAG